MPDQENSTAPDTPALHPVAHWQQLAAYRTINGRTFHSENGSAQYWASNDEKQNESMDIVHHFLYLLFDDQLYLSPLNCDIQTVLDIGTGTGLWAIDFAEEFPDTEVIGTDISPIQPSWAPSNVKFEIEDCNQEWTYKPNSVDFIHSRYLYGSLKDWSVYFQQAFKTCKEGGWVESHEASATMQSDDGSVPEDSAMREWGKFFIEGGKKMGQSFTVVEDDLQRQNLIEAGFVDVCFCNKKVPIGGWPQDPKMKEIGEFVLAALEHDIEGYVSFDESSGLGNTTPTFGIELCTGESH
ncbi:methyltransferase [Fusarium albosuccineum]|uniref:Methyltransferase n=1 Tax=Fusarium albosuccineum TaxID=1237068 RepID=A0A8H4L0E1_9HYPO|nr:methyltransferase [Fusarium albosuccineum]